MSHMQAGVMFSFRKSSQNIFLSISRGNTACSYKSISLCVFRQHLQKISVFSVCADPQVDHENSSEWEKPSVWQVSIVS